MPKKQAEAHTEKKEDKPEEKKVSGLKEVKQVTHKLKQKRFSTASSRRQHWYAMPETTHTVEDTLKPEYWMHIAHMIQGNAEIDAMWEDGSRYVKYLVLHASEQAVYVAVLLDVDLTKTRTTQFMEEDDQYDVKFVSHFDRWCVVRKSDNMKMSKNHKSRDQAYAWLASNTKKIDL